MIKNLNVFTSDEERSEYLYYGYSVKDKFSDSTNFYHRYKEGSLEGISKDTLQNMEILDFLEKLGFSINNPGTYLYKDMIVKAMHYLNGTDDFGNSISKEELLRQMKTPFSQFYTNVARNDLDIGIKTFHAYIESAIENVNYANADTALLFQIYSNFSRHSNYGEYAFVIGQYINDKEKNDNKGVVKQITMAPVNVQVGN